MNQLIKKGLCGLITIATLVGTYSGREGDFPILYSNKTGDSYGINLSVRTNLQEGSTINGVNISLLTHNYGGTINGANFGIINFGYGGGKINGLEVSLANGHAFDKRDASELSGLAIGLYNNHTNLKGVQLGIYSGSTVDNEDKKRAGILLNADYVRTEK